jgi:beta propeller repeat protein
MILVSPIIMPNSEGQELIYPKWTVSGWEYRVTFDGGEQTECDIWEDVVVYKSWEAGNSDIFIYNIENGTKSRITSDNSVQKYPSIFQDRVVYQDNRNGNWDIYMFNITTWTETRITTNTADQERPDIYGDLIVYIDGRNPSDDIYMYDVSSSSEENIGDSDSYAYRPRISSDLVVWREVSGSEYKINAYRIESGNIVLSAWSTTRKYLYPDVHEQTLAYEISYGFQNNSIIMRSLNVFDTRDLERTNRGQNKPTVWGGKVLWSDEWDDDTLVCQDLTTGVLKEVESSFTDKSSFRMWGDRVVYRSGRYGNFDIYYNEFDEDHDGIPDSEDAFPGNPVDHSDLDGDGIGDNADPDTDGDGVPDLRDAFPLNSKEWSDYDNDGFGDNKDMDDDNDGIPDSKDEDDFNPLNGIADTLDLLLSGMSDMKSDLTTRIMDLEVEMMEIYTNLNESLQLQMETDLAAILLGIQGVSENLSHLDTLDTSDMEELVSRLDTILVNITDSGELQMENLNSGISQLGHAIESLSDLVNSIYSKTEMNYSKDLDDIMVLVEQISNLEEMVEEMEDLNSEMSSQKEAIDSTKDTSRTLSIIIIVILVILLVIILAGFLKRPGKVDDLE